VPGCWLCWCCWSLARNHTGRHLHMLGNSMKITSATKILHFAPEGETRLSPPFHFSIWIILHDTLETAGVSVSCIDWESTLHGRCTLSWVRLQHVATCLVPYRRLNNSCCLLHPADLLAANASHLLFMVPRRQLWTDVNVQVVAQIAGMEISLVRRLVTQNSSRGRNEKFKARRKW
jgi:hypothetical protein